MSLLYRAIWNEDRPNLIAVAAETFRRWLEHKRYRLAVWPDGDLELASDQGTSRLAVRRARCADLEALRASLAEERQTEGETWTTTLTVITQEPGPVSTLWVMCNA